MEYINSNNSRLEKDSELFIAHVRQEDRAEQSLYAHLTGTTEIEKWLSVKIGMPLSVELLGLLHDLEKYSQAFKVYIWGSIKFDNYKNLGLDED